MRVIVGSSSIIYQISETAAPPATIRADSSDTARGAAPSASELSGRRLTKHREFPILGRDHDAESEQEDAQADESATFVGLLAQVRHETGADDVADDASTDGRGVHRQALEHTAQVEDQRRSGESHESRAEVDEHSLKACVSGFHQHAETAEFKRDFVRDDGERGAQPDRDAHEERGADNDAIGEIVDRVRDEGHVTGGVDVSVRMIVVVVLVMHLHVRAGMVAMEIEERLHEEAEQVSCDPQKCHVHTSDFAGFDVLVGFRSQVNEGVAEHRPASQAYEDEGEGGDRVFAARNVPDRRQRRDADERRAPIRE